MRVLKINIIIQLINYRVSIYGKNYGLQYCTHTWPSQSETTLDHYNCNNLNPKKGLPGITINVMQIVAALIYEFLWNHLVDRFFWMLLMCPAKFEGFAVFHLLPNLLCQGDYDYMQIDLVFTQDKLNWVLSSPAESYNCWP